MMMKMKRMKIRNMKVRGKSKRRERVDIIRKKIIMRNGMRIIRMIK
jgi:hypothetical protein